MRIIASKHTSRPIFAADGDDQDAGFEDFDDAGLDDAGFDDPGFDEGEDGIDDQLDEISDAVDELQDDVDEIQEDDVDIELDNNIDGHLIAECDKCHGIFISAVIESDQDIEKVSGTCPICGKESDQFLKWVVKDVHSS